MPGPVRNDSGVRQNDMIKMMYLSNWLKVWSVIFFITRGNVPSPFALNIVVTLMVVVGQASTEVEWQRYLFTVLTHLLPVILTLPPRFTAPDGVSTIVFLIAYFLYIHLSGGNIIDVYGQHLYKGTHEVDGPGEHSKGPAATA